MTGEELRNYDFILLVKRTREKYSCSIDEAHDLIFADNEIRRLVAARINRDPQCRKMARKNLAREGNGSRFVMDGDRIRFRSADGQRPE